MLTKHTIAIVVFIVAMILWGITVAVDPPAPYVRGRSACAFIAVLALFFIVT